MPRIGATPSDERILELLERNLAWRPLFCGERSTEFATPELQSQASDSFARAMTELSVQPLDREFQIRPNERRHVVWLVLESFRSDLLTPDTMPRCSRVAQQGLTLERHYSNSNMSHYGLFSLMYSRSPFLYFQVLDRKIRPQACQTFRDSGYQSTFITSGDCTNWLRMGEFLGKEAFDDVVIHQQKSWVERDRSSLSKVAELLKRDPQTDPQFVVCFLVATHFPYEYPPEFQIHEPVAPVRDVLAAYHSASQFEPEAIRNRQLNTAGFLDVQIYSLIQSLDSKKSLLMMTGDHGESFRDDGCYFHGSRLSDAQTRVPMFFWGDVVPKRTTSHLTSHVDVLPTTLSLLTGGRTLKSLHGRDVLAERRPEPEQLLLAHGRLMTNIPFERVVLVSHNARLPMLLHKGSGGGVTVLDPVDHNDRSLPPKSPSEATIRDLAWRIDKAFESMIPQRLVVQVRRK